MQAGFSSYAQEELIQHISQKNHGCAQEHKSHDHFQDHPRPGESHKKGWSNPESITQPS